jgi:hypothetical protein
MQRCWKGEGEAQRRSGDRLDPLPAPKYPFSSHLNATEQDDTRDRLSIEHSEKRLAGRFYLLLFFQFHGCSGKLGDAYSRTVLE